VINCRDALYYIMTGETSTAAGLRRWGRQRGAKAKLPARRLAKKLLEKNLTVLRQARSPSSARHALGGGGRLPDPKSDQARLLDPSGGAGMKQFLDENPTARANYRRKLVRLGDGRAHGSAVGRCSRALARQQPDAADA
jgi:hypothetical protein